MKVKRFQNIFQENLHCCLSAPASRRRTPLPLPLHLLDHLRQQTFALLLAHRVNRMASPRPIRIPGRIPPLPQVVADPGHATRPAAADLAPVRRERGRFRGFGGGLSVCARLRLAAFTIATTRHTAVDLCGSLFPHRVVDVGVDVQRRADRFVSECRGERLDVHAAFQAQFCECMPLWYN